jgi:hypothetical protein
VGKLEGSMSTSTRCKWVDNIKIDLREISWGDVDSIGLDQVRDWCRVHKMLGKFLSNCTSGGVSRRAKLHGVSASVNLLCIIEHLYSEIQSQVVV